jgi:ABC-type multidrug transport system ATPase subunit
MAGDQNLELDGISKLYGDVVALDGLSLEVPAGDLFGFVGRNGAGTTTAMRIVVGVLAADSGEVQFGGKPLTFAVRRQIGAAVDTDPPGHDPSTSVKGPRGRPRSLPRSQGAC